MFQSTVGVWSDANALKTMMREMAAMARLMQAYQIFMDIESRHQDQGAFFRGWHVDMPNE